MTVTAVNSPPDTDLLKWYFDRAQEDEHFHLDGHEKRIQFISGINIAVLAAVGAGLFKAERWDHYCVLLAGPAFMLLTNYFAIEGCSRYYQRFLEAIVVKAHVQQALGLTVPLALRASIRDSESYWTKEPPVPARHLEVRKTASSQEFVAKHMKSGAQRFARQLFMSYQLLAFMLILFIALMLAIRLVAAVCSILRP